MQQDPLNQSKVTDKKTYQKSVQVEIEHYTTVYQNEESRKTLTEKVPPSWFYVESKINDLIRQKNEGRDFGDEIYEHMRSHPGSQTLSIGSGPGAVELQLARRLAQEKIDYEIICMDINPHVLALGRARAETENLRVSFVEQDINALSLEINRYDIIMCHASLHHLINLEHIYYEMNKSLKDDGKAVVLDIATRNGYLMWDETYMAVRNLWKVLPEKFRYNHTAYPSVTLDDEYINRDYTGDSMECIRSQDVLPLLNEYFSCQTYVPLTSIARRFLDTMYGPNYDPSLPLDQALMEFIWQLDILYLSQGLLKPETFFGVYKKGPQKPPPPKYLEMGFPSRQPAPENISSSVPLGAQLTARELTQVRQILAIYQRFRQSRIYNIFRSVARRIL